MRELAAALLLFALNAAIAWRLFWVEYTPNWNSVEGSFVGLVRYLSRHWGEFSWFPLWHCGMPYQDTYVPLLHLASAMAATGLHVSALRGYHIVTAIAYCLGPVTLYLMCRRLDAPRAAAFATGLAFSLFSPIALLVPEIWADIINPLSGRRLQILTEYGEGPHVAALTFLPVVILALEYALRRRTTRALALAALPIAILLLTNVIGALGLGLAVFCWLCVQPADRRAAAWRLATGAAVFAYAIACFGMPPSSVITIAGNAGGMHAGFSHTIRTMPYLLPLVLLATAAAGYGLARLSLPLYLRFGALNFALTFVLVYTARNAKAFELWPQAGRMQMECEIGAAVVLGWLLWLLYSQPLARYAVLGFGAVAIYYQWGNYAWRTKLDLSPVNPSERSEYTSAQWIDRNMPGRRVYATGSTGFWLNVFTEAPQLTGCCEQGKASESHAAVSYLLNNGVLPGQVRTAARWLQALGVHAIIVNGPESNDEYKDYLKPERFAEVLPVLHRERGDTIYEIPQRTTSQAHVILAGEVIPPAANGVPADAYVERYVTAIQDPQRAEASCQWVRPYRARIHGRVAPGEVISVQVTGVRGWKAQSGGVAQPLTKDGLSFLVIHPTCQDCTIDLEWTGPSDYYIAALITLLALGAFAWFVLRPAALPV